MSQSAAVEAKMLLDGSIRPLGFVWKGRSMKITSWGRQWEKNEASPSGGSRHFLVMTAGDRVWELRFTPANLHWSIHPRHHARRVV